MSGVIPEHFGASVAISGATVVVGTYVRGPFKDMAYLFSQTAAGWTQSAVLEGSETATGDLFGASVGVSGTIALVGAPNRANGAGRTCVFMA